MNNLQPDSIIACLDSPQHVRAVLDASMWAAKRLQSPIGLLHAAPNKQYKNAIDYSCCLVGNDDHHLLNELTLKEQSTNGKLRDQGRLLLKQSDDYCQQTQGRYEHKTYILHRHDTIAQSLDDVDKVAQLVVIGHEVTCKTTLSQLIRASDCPILVTHSPFVTPKTALFAYDNSPTCQALLEWLSQNALMRHVTLHVIMVGQENETNKYALREAYARLKQSGINCKKALIDSRDVAAAIVYYQRENNLDMLISGAFGESRLREFFQGSDTQKLLVASKTPYLLYPRV